MAVDFEKSDYYLYSFQIIYNTLEIMEIYVKFVIDKYLEIAEYKALCNGFRYYYLLGNLRQYADTSSHLPYLKRR